MKAIERRRLAFWSKMGRRLQELNPPTFDQVAGLMAELLEAEEDLARPQVALRKLIRELQS